MTTRAATPEGRRPRSQPPPKAAHGAEAAGTANVRVVCRLRPMSDREKRLGTVPAASASSERKEVAVTRKNGGGRSSRMTFKFDEVLSSFSTQEDVFQTTLAPLVPQVLAGYEATAFAYGQTGTGKTYTMEGHASVEEDRGLMPRAASAVLEALAKGKYTHHFITVSYLEIYNEELTDLLAPVQNQPKLDLLEAGGNRGVCCVGLSEIPVSSLDDIIRLVCAAQERRRVAETRINARSSRSHCIFTMKVLCRKMCPGGEQETVGKLHLVDLAGSECAKKAAYGGFEEPAASPTVTQRPTQAGGCVQDLDRERKNINQSLLTLRRVIAALREKSGRVPYRDSKLTRLLQSALGGSCKTVVIATISPALAVVEETISTLTYAEQAAGIQNKPIICSSLRPQGSGGVFFDAFNNGMGEMTPCAIGEWSADVEMKLSYLSQEVEEAQARLIRKQQELQEAAERADLAEQRLEERDVELVHVRQELENEKADKARVLAGISALALELASAARPLAAAREDIVGGLARLGQVDALAAEAQLAELVKGQQAALQAELDEARTSLDSVRAELRASRAELDSVRTSQARGRGSVLEAIAELARRELDSLGGELDKGSQATVVHLDRVQACAEAAGDAATGAERRVAAAGAGIERGAGDWARAVAEGCDVASRRSQEATAEVERSTATLAARLRALAGEQAEGVFEDAAVAEGSEEPTSEDCKTWDAQLAKENDPDATGVIAKAGGDDAGKIVVGAGKVKAMVAAANKAQTASAAPRPLREVNC